ncbi:MAG: 5'-deoxynucleotidase [Clostridia bacterium]|nr:5'-deoxynucleotidase [Clostridia bacterium]
MGKNKFHFFAMLSRMKYINRWALMRNTHVENISEHSLEVAAIAHALAVIHNKRFGGSVNAERAAVIGIYHDAPEIITGDMPTPVKYFSPQIREAYGQVEEEACAALLKMLPEDLRGEYTPLFFKQEQDEKLWQFVKAADKICAYTKCIEEGKAGNSDFNSAAKTNLEAIMAIDMPEVRVFMDEFIDSYAMTIDELK